MTGGVGYTHIHIYIYMTYQERCIGQTVLLGGIWAFILQENGGDVQVLPAREAVSSPCLIYVLFVAFLSSLLLLLLLLLLLSSLLIPFLLVYLLTISFPYSSHLTSLPSALDFLSFPFLCRRQRCYFACRCNAERGLVAVLQWSGC
ncbi:hypothetical protein V8C35DRAFT_303528 [Trichoderma chlorosporum]